MVWFVFYSGNNHSCLSFEECLLFMGNKIALIFFFFFFIYIYIYSKKPSILFSGQKKKKKKERKENFSSWEGNHLGAN
jgi:hypothetical protein